MLQLRKDDTLLEKKVRNVTKGEERYVTRES